MNYDNTNASLISNQRSRQKPTRIGLVVLFDLLRVNLPLWDHKTTKLGSQSYCHGRRPGWMEENLQAWDTAIPGNQSSTLEIRYLFFFTINENKQEKITTETGDFLKKLIERPPFSQVEALQKAAGLKDQVPFRARDEGTMKVEFGGWRSWDWLKRIKSEKKYIDYWFDPFFHEFPRKWHHNFQISSFGGGFQTCFMSLRWVEWARGYLVGGDLVAQEYYQVISFTSILNHQSKPPHLPLVWNWKWQNKTPFFPGKSSLTWVKGSC